MGELTWRKQDGGNVAHMNTMLVLWVVRVSIEVHGLVRHRIRNRHRAGGGRIGMCERSLAKTRNGGKARLTQQRQED